MYDRGLGVPHNPEKARHWYLQAANQGDPDAQTNLGVMYMDGEGGPVDLETGIDWIKKAAAKGALRATGCLATAYDNGTGVPKDSRKAFELYMQLAGRSEFDPIIASAQYNIAVAYLKGDGVEPDLSRAMNWWERAAQQGHAKARECLRYYSARR
jgi:TPR repeat protein